MFLKSLRHWAEVRPFLFSLGFVGAATAVCLPGRDLLEKGHWALLYLLVISIVASLAGTAASLAAALAAFLAWDVFFLPPYGTFRVDDPKDWISLGVFLVVGILIGLISGRLRKRETLAISQEREMTLLNRLTARLLAISTPREMAEVLGTEMEGVFSPRFIRFHLLDASGNRTLLFDMKRELEIDPLEDDFLEWVAEHHQGAASPTVRGNRPGSPGGGAVVAHSFICRGVSRNDIFLPALSPSGIEGILQVGERRGQEPYTWNEVQVLFAAANMAGTFLERTRLEESARQAETLEESDKLKSAILSSVSHELKTPLSSMKATISGLVEEDVSLDPVHVRQELGAVSKDLDRLSHSIDSLLDLSRLSAAAWKPDLQWVEAEEVIGWVLLRLEPAFRGRVKVSFPEDVPLILVDFQQWGRLLMHILENALSYSPRESQVTVDAEKREGRLEIRIADEGAGIPEAEREMVFTKFYRGTRSNLAHGGTGLGLPIAREIARVHDGTIRIEDNSPHGARIVITLPGSHLKDREIPCGYENS